MANIADVYRGDTWTGATFQTPATTLDFTGCTLHCQIRRSEDDPHYKEVTISDIDNTGTAIGASLSMPDTLTAKLSKGIWYGDVEARLANGETYTICKFKLNVDPDITRP